MRAPVVLHAISSFDDTVLDRTAPVIMKGLASCIAVPGALTNEVTKSPDFWSTLQRLHQHKTEAEKVFAILTTLATSNPTTVTADNFESAIALANDFAAAGAIGSIQEKRKDFAAKRGHQAKPARDEEIAVVQRAIKAVSLIYQLSDRIPGLIAQSHLERNEAWAAYWSPIFRGLCTQCVNPCREVRHRALSALQRTLLSETVADREQHTEWTAIFDEVLFPMTLKLLKPEIYQVDPFGMNDTRAHAASLLCKIFLRYLDRLVEVGRMKDVWMKVLELLDRLMNAGAEGDALAEAVLEGVKNVLLVMDGTGYLARDEATAGPESHIQPVLTEGDGAAEEAVDGGEKQEAKSEDVQIWPETVRRLDRFLPGLVQELFPPPPDPPEARKAETESHTKLDATS